MRPTRISTITLTDDANGIAEDQTLGSATDFALDGALVADGIATAAEAQIVSITSVGNDSGITFTVSGTDADGATQSEVVTGANAGIAVTVAYFKTVTQVATSGATAADVSIGWVAANGAVTKSIPCNWRMTPFNQYISVAATGTMTYTVQHTADSPERSYTNTFSTDANWRPTVGLTDVTSNDEGTIGFPIRAVRLQMTVYTSGATTLTVIQSN